MNDDVRRLVYFDNLIDPVFLDVLGREPWIEIINLDQNQSEDEVFEVLRTAHGLQMLSKTEMLPKWRPDRAFLEKCPNLLALSAVGAGYDACDDAACTDLGIMVVNNSGANSDSVAQHAIGMVLALGKNMIRHDRMMRKAPGLDRMQYPGKEATGKTLGIVGLGQIGRRTAKIASQALGMNVIAYDPYIGDEDFTERNAEKTDFETLFRTADFISVHCPLTSETRGMIDAAAFALMKPTAYFITTARGFVHDEAALVQALADGLIDGAGVDVFDQEPPGPGHPLMQFENVLMTPHAAGITDVCNYKMGKWGAEQWIEVLRGHRPPRLVNPAVWDKYVERRARIIGHPHEG